MMALQHVGMGARGGVRKWLYERIRFGGARSFGNGGAGGGGSQGGIRKNTENEIARKEAQRQEFRKVLLDTMQAADSEIRGGLVILDKPVGEHCVRFSRTSVKRLLKESNVKLSRVHLNAKLGGGHLKVGHVGTLDPQASGLLPVGFGTGTRLVGVMDLFAPKRYVAHVRLGQRTDTGDVAGRIVVESDAPFTIPEQAVLDDTCRSFLGEITQQPPQASAIKINGKAAYKLFRENVNFQVPLRQVMIHELSCTAFDSTTLKLDVLCGSGTFIRTLGEDFAKALGCNESHLTYLRRVRTGVFTEADIGRVLSTSEILRSFPKIMSPISLEETLFRVGQYFSLSFLDRQAVDALPGTRFALYHDDFPDIPIVLLRVCNSEEKVKKGSRFLVEFSELTFPLGKYAEALGKRNKEG